MSERGRPVLRWGAAALLVLLSTNAFPLAAADHPQAAHGDAIVFDHRGGNEWWVEVKLSGGASGSVHAVQAQDTGGPWTPLTLRSWGAWAASFHIEPGHQVRFRASWSGDMVDSCWFDHPSGVEDCGTPPPPPPGTFDATWSRVQGNEWWVEAVITANAPINAVFLTLDCDTSADPHDMVYKADWGKWVLGNVRIPVGAKVTMEAHGGDGSDRSGGYVWPQATPTAGCDGSPPPAFAADFRNARGNEWWVEVDVTADRPLAGVDARVGCTSDGWMPLTKRSWGSWAASFHVAPGSTVDFRARSTDGASDLSDGHVWPQATPTGPCDAAWPQQGSFAAYTLHAVDEGPGSPIRRTSDATLRITYDGARWSGTCQGTTLEEDSSTGTSRRWDWTVAQNEGPPSSSRSPTVGSTFPVHPLVPSGFGGCGHTEEVIHVTGQGLVDTHMRHPDGRPVSLQAWIGEEPPGESGHHDTWVAWETRLGLLVEWTHGGHAGSYTGSMTDTDAPIR